MTIRSINHVQLAFPAALETQVRLFYKGVLGLAEAAYAPGETLRYKVGKQRIDLFPAVSFTPALTAHLALDVSNLARWRDRLLAARVEIDESRPLPGHKRFYLKDPAGNTLELLEPVAQGEGA